ncbi:MAG: hypothetical protein EA413_00485, partial [Cyanobium sp. PLM2.Bin73]
MQRFPGPQHELPQGGLLIYVAPQALLSEHLDGPALLAGFRALLERGPGRRLIADWRLLGLEPEEIAGWLKDDHPCPPAHCPAPTPADPLQALLLSAVLDSAPELLDSYLDLELQAELAQTAADSTYDQRWRASLQLDPLLDAWRAQQHQLSEREQQVEAQQARMA